MNEQLQTALAELIGAATTVGRGSVDFLRAELPDVIRQLLVWKAVSSALGLVLVLAMAIVAFFLFRRGFRVLETIPVKRESYESDPRFWTRLWLIVGSVVCGFTLAVGVLSSFEWLQILIAPKLYLIEYAARLAK